MRHKLFDTIRYGKRIVKQLVGLEPRFGIQIDCPKEYHGSRYGGWCICPVNLNPTSIVYSFGVGEDISFDLSLIKKFGITIHAFDPTPKSINWAKSQDLPHQFKLFEYGVADFDGIAHFTLPQNPEYVSGTILERPSNLANRIQVLVYRLTTILAKLEHLHIDLLKMDIEGAEYGVISDLIKSNTTIGQILIEFHHRFDEVDISKTTDAIYALNNAGYKIFHISPSGEEYSFIKEKELHAMHQQDIEGEIK